MRESRTAVTPVDIFLHIPKTAGETMTAILWRQYGESGFLEVPDPHVVGEPGRPDASFASVKRLVGSNPSQFRLVYGHMPFGIHEAVARPIRYFTMVRSPVERAVSHFHYVRREPRHRLHQEVVESRMTLHEYVTSGIAGELENGQTALLAGFEQGAPSDDATILDRALANIEASFMAVGMTEDFDRSVVLFKLALGWKKPVVYETLNATSGRLPVTAVQPATIDAIEARNLLDAALYRSVRTRFDAQIEDAGVTMERELRQLRLGNALYRRYRNGPRRLMLASWDRMHRLVDASEGDEASGIHDTVGSNR